ncbi:MAG: homoserine O-acetyltransferase [Oligosphaeraceae bacterium]|nr:homoserine O-acetyltransferase [Oligosphaeraceae bacterium]
MSNRNAKKSSPGLRQRQPYDPPESPQSVGWTTPRTAQLADDARPFVLHSGKVLSPLVVEYETYGELAPDAANAILITHALTGDAHVAGWDRTASALNRPWRCNKPGWWDEMVGPGKTIDTKRFFVICLNVAGSCYGSTGPSSLDPATGRKYGLSFPFCTVGDWVRMQALLLDQLGIAKLYAVCGGSLGGQQALEWALAFPERVGKCIVLAAGPVLSAQGLAFNAVARQCIMNDPEFRGGDYPPGGGPQRGLAAARMLAHITYLSGAGMDSKFGRRRQREFYDSHTFEVEFAVESYLEYQGRSFVERFDANSYLYLTRAMDYFDVAEKWGDGDLRRACRRIRSQMLVLSFSSDWLYPPASAEEFVSALLYEHIPVSYVQIETMYGHDAFLVEAGEVGRVMHAFLHDPVDRRSTSTPNHDRSQP